MGLVIAALDWSSANDRVVESAMRAAAAYGHELRLIHVAAPTPDFVGYEVGPDVVRQDRANELRREHRHIQELAERCDAKGIKTTALLVAGPTAQTLVEQAREHDAQMIVMGSHGHGGLYHLLMGSVTEGVLRQASCPVLVVPCRQA